MDIDELIDKYLESDLPVEEFIEIESMDLGDTPESSPKPNKKDDDENEIE